VHNHPETAVSDGPQSLYPEQFATMMNDIELIAPIVGRNLARGVHAPVQAAASGQ
jgi:3-deoxy-7-phosphoheptulonate synthase